MSNSFSLKSLAQQVAERIETEILEGRFQPGQRLLESTLCEEWNISRSPIREAMRILTGEGLLVFRPRKGTFVSPLSRAELEDLYTIRANLESLAFSLSIRKNGPQILAEMRHVQDCLKYAIENGKIHDFNKLNIRFHNIYIEACENPRLISMLYSLEKHIQRYRNKTLLKRGFAEVLKNHENIIQLVANGDPEVAEEARKQRILSNITLILQDFN